MHDTLRSELAGVRVRGGEALPEQTFQEICQHDFDAPLTWEVLETRGDANSRELTRAQGRDAGGQRAPAERLGPGREGSRSLGFLRGPAVPRLRCQAVSLNVLARAGAGPVAGEEASQRVSESPPVRCACRGTTRSRGGTPASVSRCRFSRACVDGEPERHDVPGSFRGSKTKARVPSSAWGLPLRLSPATAVAHS